MSDWRFWRGAKADKRKAVRPDSFRRETHRIDANGLQHYVVDAGDEDAPAALLLHGFPESHAAWDAVTPLLVAAGYRVIAPDLRGFGETDMAASVDGYDLYTCVAPDMLALCNALEINRAHLVGHDFGAPVAWILAAQHADRFETLTALTAGHARAFLSSGADQALKSWYILFHQLRGVCEAAYRFNNWAMLRWHWAGRDDIDDMVRDLARPGRLTAGLNWYRANISIGRMLKAPKPGAFGEEVVRIPTLGVWAEKDRYLGEAQMKQSNQFVEAPWRYERMDGTSHWIPTEAPEALASMLIEHWRTHASPQSVPNDQMIFVAFAPYLRSISQ